MREPGTTLQTLRYDPNQYRGWNGVTLVTNLFDYDEVKSICDKEKLDATILIRISEEEVIPYEKVNDSMKAFVKFAKDKEKKESLLRVIKGGKE